MPIKTNPALATRGSAWVSFERNGPADNNRPTPAAQAISAELIGSNQAGAAGIVAIGHAPVSKLCRRLIEAGHNPNLPLEVYRGTTLCLRVRSIDEGAALSVEDDENGRPRFVRHRPRTFGAAPYVAQAVRPVP